MWMFCLFSFSYVFCIFFFFFFFQAEDGIRDTSVTGVQTCALPISFHDAVLQRLRDSIVKRHSALSQLPNIRLLLLDTDPEIAKAATSGPVSSAQIGRASCRERE